MNRPRVAIVALALLGVSAGGLVAIQDHEGDRLKAYTPVQGDVPTIGTGITTYENGSRVKLGDVITPERGARLLKHHIKVKERIVLQCVKVPLHQYEFDTYVSLAYNIGGKAFCGSTLVRKLNVGDYVGACAQILRWDHFKGKPLRGLTNRRQAEYKQCKGEL